LEESLLITIHNGAFGPLVLTSPRDTESADNRITENLNPRIVDGFSINTVESSFTITPRLIPFSSKFYIKQNGVWRESFPSVNRAATWVSPLKVFKNINSVWKRVY
jgi:hypothetical protein